MNVCYNLTVVLVIKNTTTILPKTITNGFMDVNDYRHSELISDYSLPTGQLIHTM